VEAPKKAPKNNRSGDCVASVSSNISPSLHQWQQAGSGVGSKLDH
jgi:hypothetical protein